MNDLEKIADNLVWKFLPKLEGWTDDSKTNLAIKCAIESVNHTIEVLERVQKECDEHRVVMPNLILVVCEQIELKKILEQKS
jgi:hypothetical protein